MEVNTERAIASYENDARFRAIAMSVVSQVLLDHGPVDPERADRDAHDIAVKVAVLLLQRVYEGDAEVVALRAERDAYKKLALDSHRMAPLGPITILAQPPHYTNNP